MVSEISSFFYDMLRLLRWSLFQPARLADHLRQLHPDLAVHAGLTHQLWLACRHVGVRRLLGMQVLLWLLAGLLGSGLFILVRAIPPTPVTLIDVLLGLGLGLSGGLALGLAGSLCGDVSLSVTLSVVGGVLLGLALGIAFVTALGGVVFSLAFALTSGIALGTFSPAFDHLHRRPMSLWGINYWGRALVGLIFVAIATVILALLLTVLVNWLGELAGQLKVQLALGLAIGLLGGLAFGLTFVVEMLIEEHHVRRSLLRWVLLDGLILGLVGSLAAALTIGVTTITNTITFIVLWAVLTAAGSVMAVRVGNGLSAILAVAGLAWVIAATPTEPLAVNTLLIVVITLLIGFYGYIRLTLYLVEIPLTGWIYWRVLRQPGRALDYLRRVPVYWDDLIFYPLPLLDRLLLLALRADRQAALPQAEFIAGSFRQAWAANRARLIYTVETLTNCASPALIAAAPTELDWLADEVMLALKQGTSEVVPRLLAIAGGVRAALAADNLYSRRLGYREALDGLDMLHRRLPSLGSAVVRRWQPVIDRWQQVLLNELEAVSAGAEVAATENPYQPGTPLQLSRQELFKGRRELREAVVNALLERHRPTLVLHGPRRMGKTSFLLQLPALLPGNTVPVFLDLQRPTATQNTAAFLYSIARAISRDARPYRLLVSVPPRPAFDESPFETFACWLEDTALADLQDFNLLLTFDEFEKLGEAVESGRLEEQIFDELRYLIQHQSRLALLFAGVQTLEELGPAWSSYFINVKPLSIGYLQPNEAEELIRRPDLGANFRLVYADEVAAEIMWLTHGHPYLLQLVCSAVVEESNARTAFHVDMPLLEAALRRALDQGEPYFSNIWHEMAGPDGQPWLFQIAHANAPLSLPDHPSLARLIRRRVISRSAAGYHVEVPLVQQWLVERIALNI